MGISATVLGNVMGDKLGDTLGDDLGAGPYSILARNKAFGADVDSRVMGTYPDIATLTDFVGPNNCDLTQSTASLRPHLVYINDLPYTDHTNQFIFGDATSNLFDAGEAEINMWCVGSVTGGVVDELVSFSDGATTECIRLFRSASDTMTATVNAGAGSTSLTAAVDIDRVHMYRVHFDGATFSLYIDGALANSVAKTGTMLADCTRVLLGAEKGGGIPLTGNARSAWLATGSLTADQVSDTDAAILADAGLRPGSEDGVDILSTNGTMGITVSDREMNAVDPDPDVKRLIDRYHNADLTQISGIASRMPDLSTMNGKTTASFVLADSQSVIKTSASSPILTIGTTDITVWFTGEIVFAQSNGSVFLMSATAVSQVILTTQTTALRASMRLGGSVRTVDFTFAYPASPAVYRLSYDGVTIRMFADGIELSVAAGSPAQTTGLTTSVDRVDLFGNNGTATGSGVLRSFWVSDGALSAQDITDMESYLTADAGL